MKTILLIWCLVTADNHPHFIVLAEPTIEQCEADGTDLEMKSDEDIMAGNITTYYGACQEDDLAPASADPRGSI